MIKIPYVALLGLAALLLGAPVLTLAAEVKYFEFSPDSGLSLNIASVATPYQLFYPQNDFLSGFDIWLTNAGDAGSATFSLRDNQNNLLALKTVSVPHMNPQWSGQMFHVAFANPVAVSSSALYKIKMTSAMPDLKLYYVPKSQLLEHNTPNNPVVAILGLAQLGTAPQDFVFKLSLYEDGDTISPIISNATSSIDSPNVLKITFNANEPIDFKITLTPGQGGMVQTKDWNGVYQFCNQGIAICVAAFDVAPGTTYNYQIFAMDYAQNVSQTNGAIEIPQTPAAGDPDPGTTISQLIISGAKIAALDPTSVAVTWQTDQAANSLMVVSTDPSGVSKVASISDATMEFFHTLSAIGALKPETNYFATVASALPTGPSASQIVSFTTPESAPNPQETSSSTPPNPDPAPNPQTQSTTTPNPSGISNPNTPPPHMNLFGQNGANDTLLEPTIEITAEASGNHILKITWQAPPRGEPNRGYQIDILDSNNNLARRIFAPSGIHQVKIKGLSPGNYHLIIYANQDGVLTKIARVLLVQIPKGKFSLLRLVITFLGTPLFYAIAIIAILVGAIAGFYIIRLKKYSRI